MCEAQYSFELAIRLQYHDAGFEIPVCIQKTAAQFNHSEIRGCNAHQQFSAYSTVLLYSMSYSKSNMS